MSYASTHANILFIVTPPNYVNNEIPRIINGFAIEFYNL